MMKQISGILLFGFVLVLGSSAASAVDIDLSVDHRAVLSGNTLSISGQVKSDSGSSGIFDYRAAVVAPPRGDNRSVVCDSGIQQTDTSGNFSFSCEIPSVEGFVSLGVDNADVRAVIPLIAGVVVNDTDTNSTKRVQRTVLFVNKEKIIAKLEAASERLDNFINKSLETIERCDSISERAAQSNLTSVIDRCDVLKERLEASIERATNTQSKINEFIQKLTDSTVDGDDLNEILGMFHTFSGNQAAIREHVTDLGRRLADLANDQRRQIADYVIERAKSIRENAGTLDASEIRSRVQELKDRRLDIISDARARIGSISPSNVGESSRINTRATAEVRTGE